MSEQASRSQDEVPIPLLEYRVFRDGNAWCATSSGFVNLQESPAGFGASPMEALGELIVEEGEK